MPRYRPLLRYAGRQRRSLVVISALTLAAATLAALQPWPMKLVVDHVLLKAPLPATLAHAFQSVHVAATSFVLLTAGALGVLLVFGLNSLLEILLTTRWTLVGRRMVYDVAQDLFARLQRRSLLYHSRTPVGEVMGRITGDSWCAYQVFDALVFAPGHALFSIVMMIFLMAQLDVKLTVIALLVAPFMVVASLLIGKPLRLAAQLKREIESRIQSHIQQTLTGIPVVQAFVQEDRERERFEQFADTAIRAQQRSTLLGSINNLGSGLITALGTGVILWLGARHVMDGRLTVGGILVFIVYLTTLQTQIKVFANVHTTLRNLDASVDRVLDVLTTEPEVPERPGACAIGKARGQVELEHVTFGYEPDRPVLRDISLAVQPGETIAIVGATGAGKTTLVNLIPRFFDPWQGRVWLDGQDVRELQVPSLRRQIAIVLQEPFLFPMSVAGNIAYGRPEATRAEIEAAAHAANAHEFITRLPSGYDAVLGERGATLSGGERQRLSIARALLKDAPILILDEPTSALDAATEQSLLEALSRLMTGRTTFIIAHRLSTVRQADRIVVLQDGRIVESGRHEELLQRGKLYARLHEIQFGPHVVAAGAD